MRACHHALCLFVFASAACGSGSGSGDPADSGTGDAPIDTSSTTDAVPEPVFPGEILSNGGFEQLDAMGWITDWENHDGNPNGAINVVTDPHKFGTHALQWQIEAAGDGREYFVIQHGINPALLVPGLTYELTGWYMIDHLGDGDIGFNYIVRGAPGGEPDIGTVADLPTHPAAENVWEPFRFEFTIPLGAAPTTYDVYLHSIKFTTMPLNLTVDGVSLHPKM